ncbi:threonine/serine exporter family protein, partial [bacterium]|nr:threonine/serine exporter family protein [bacterium]
MKINDKAYLNRHALFLIDLAEALLEAGCSTHRLEYQIEKICIAKGLEIEILVVPTGIHLQLKHYSAIITRFVRVKKLGIKMSRLHDLSDFCDAIINKGIGTRLAKKRLEKILQTEDPYSQTIVFVCFLLVSMCFQMMLGGGQFEFLFSAFLGGVVYVSENFFAREERTSFLSNFISAFLVSTFCVLCQKFYSLQN